MSDILLTELCMERESCRMPTEMYIEGNLINPLRMEKVIFNGQMGIGTVDIGKMIKSAGMVNFGIRRAITIR